MRIRKYSSLALAQSAASHQVHYVPVIMGCDGKYWVAPTMRQACAQVCDQHQEGGIGGWKHNTPMDCAAAIRARGTPPVFTLAEQWTEEEIAAIKARGAQPLVFNEIKKGGTP